MRKYGKIIISNNTEKLDFCLILVMERLLNLYRDFWDMLNKWLDFVYIFNKSSR